MGQIFLAMSEVEDLSLSSIYIIYFNNLGTKTSYNTSFEPHKCLKLCREYVLCFTFLFFGSVSDGVGSMRSITYMIYQDKV